MILVVSTGVNRRWLPDGRRKLSMDQYANCGTVVLKVYNLTKHEKSEKHQEWAAVHGQARLNLNIETTFWLRSCNLGVFLWKKNSNATSNVWLFRFGFFFTVTWQSTSTRNRFAVLHFDTVLPSNPHLSQQDKGHFCMKWVWWFIGFAPQSCSIVYNLLDKVSNKKLAITYGSSDWSIQLVITYRLIPISMLSLVSTNHHSVLLSFYYGFDSCWTRMFILRLNHLSVTQDTVL